MVIQGDSLSSVGSFIGGIASAFALIILIITSYKQIHDARKQLEVEKERSEHARFNSIFFPLIDNLRNNASSAHQNSLAIIKRYHELEGEQKKNGIIPEYSKELMFESATIHVFNQIFFILETINTLNQDSNKEDDYSSYINLLRGAVTNETLNILHYYLWNYGADSGENDLVKFKRLTVKFDLFKLSDVREFMFLTFVKSEFVHMVSFSNPTIKQLLEERKFFLRIFEKFLLPIPEFKKDENNHKHLLIPARIPKYFPVSVVSCKRDLYGTFNYDYYDSLSHAEQKNIIKVIQHDIEQFKKHLCHTFSLPTLMDNYNNKAEVEEKLEAIFQKEKNNNFANFKLFYIKEYNLHQNFYFAYLFTKYPKLFLEPWNEMNYREMRERIGTFYSGKYLGV